VCVQPHVGLLADVVDLCPRHLRRNAFEQRLAVQIAFGEGQLVPEVGLRVILRNSAAGPKMRSEGGHRRHILLLSRALKPLHSLHVVLQNAIAIAVKRSKPPLRFRVALLGHLAQLFRPGCLYLVAGSMDRR